MLCSRCDRDGAESTSHACPSPTCPKCGKAAGDATAHMCHKWFEGEVDKEVVAIVSEFFSEKKLLCPSCGKKIGDHDIWMGPTSADCLVKLAKRQSRNTPSCSPFED